MKFKMKGKAGFSLVELMIVVGIIGILASLGMPKLQQFLAKARQTEAKSKLTQVYTLNEMYILDKSVYTEDLDLLGYTKSGSNNLYGDPSIALDTPTTGGYTATVKLIDGNAICSGDKSDDWTITHTRVMTGEAPKCNK